MDHSDSSWHDSFSFSLFLPDQRSPPQSTAVAVAAAPVSAAAAAAAVAAPSCFCFLIRASYAASSFFSFLAFCGAGTSLFSEIRPNLA